LNFVAHLSKHEETSVAKYPQRDFLDGVEAANMLHKQRTPAQAEAIDRIWKGADHRLFTYTKRRWTPATTAFGRRLGMKSSLPNPSMHDPMKTPD